MLWEHAKEYRKDFILRWNINREARALWDDAYYKSNMADGGVLWDLANMFNQRWKKPTGDPDWILLFEDTNPFQLIKLEALSDEQVNSFVHAR